MTDRIAAYVGSFDPLTLGHLDIITRAARLFDRLVIGIGINPAKSPFLSLQTRLSLIQADTAHLPITVHPCPGLAIDFARTHQATTLIRGLRTAADYNDEQPMAALNRRLAPDIETILLIADPALQPISSTLIRQLATANANLTPFLPPATLAALQRQKGQGSALDPLGGAPPDPHQGST